MPLNPWESVSYPVVLVCVIAIFAFVTYESLKTLDKLCHDRTLFHSFDRDSPMLLGSRLNFPQLGAIEIDNGFVSFFFLINLAPL